MPRKAKAPGYNAGPRTDVSTISPTPTATYGEKTALAAGQQAINQSAPPAPTAVPAGSRVHPLAPTQIPTEPVTAGLPTGPGPGPEALNGPNDTVAGLAKHLPYLEYAARNPDTPQVILNFVQYLKSVSG